MLFEDDHFYRYYQVFFDALLEGGIMPIAQAAYDLLQIPLIINDEAGNTLLQIPDNPIGDPDWDYSHAHKTIQREHYLHLYQHYISKTTQHNRPILIKEGFYEEQNQVICILSDKRNVMAMAAFIIHDRDISDEELNIIRIFISALRSELRRQHALSVNKTSRLRTVLEADNTSSEQYNLCFSALKKLYVPNYQILQIDLISSADYELIEVIPKDLNSNCSNCISTPMEHSAAVLLHNQNGKNSSLEEALKILSNYPVYISQSSVFSDLDQINQYHFQARMTMKAGNVMHPEKRVYDYNSNVPFQIYAAASETGSLSPFVDPVVYTIHLYDIDNNTNYLHTLEIYLFSSKNKTLTTQRLYIHPNTLTYRLNKIWDLFHIQLNDDLYCEYLYSSILLWKYLNHMQAQTIETE